MKTPRQLLDDCFLHDKDRMRHHQVLETLNSNLSLIVDSQTVPLDAAVGRIAAQNVTAPRNVPLTNNTAVDGYAFAHKDYIETGGKLALGALIAAGQTHDLTLNKGECARIFTGATMPHSAETVAMQEDCDIADDGLIHIPSGLKYGANCRKAGEDLSAGETLIDEGDFLSPARIAALASIGVHQISVRKKLRIALVSTGDEIIEPDQEINQGQIYDANRPMLKALLNSPAVQITDCGIVKDTEDALTHLINDAALNHDLILTSGGASRGDEDHMLNVLSNLGKRHLWQIAIKPGRPMMFGQIKNCVIMGLPGNPVAAMVCSNLYVFTVIAKLLGANKKSPQGFHVQAGFEIKKKKPDRREFLRGWIETGENGSARAMKFERDGSGLISGLRKAEGLIEIAENVEKIAKGDLVKFIPFDAYKLG